MTPCLTQVLRLGLTGRHILEKIKGQSEGEKSKKGFN